MIVDALVMADFETAPFGGPSQLLTPLAGAPVLLRTLRRVAATPGLRARYVCCRPAARDTVEMLLRRGELADQFGVRTDETPEPKRLLIRTARKWALESWRSNPLGLTWFDEYFDALRTAQHFNALGAERLLCIDGHQPAFDVGIARAMLDHLSEYTDEAPYVFTQAPPGLAGLIVGARVLDDLLRLDVPFGLLLSYRPEIPQGDPITSTCCLPVGSAVMHTAARFVADTAHGRSLLAVALERFGEGVDAEQLCEAASAPSAARGAVLPVELEIELTTEHPLPDTSLRPRGPRVPRRALDDLAAVQRVAAEMASLDDRLVWLGGQGDPLASPLFASVCTLLRGAGVFGLGAATPLVDLPDAAFDALFDARVDVLEVQLDAHSTESYRSVHGRDAYALVMANVERIERRREAERSPWPVLVPSQTRCAATLHELEAFHDAWIRRVGTALIRGYSTFAGMLPPDTLLPASAGARVACRGLNRRLVLLSDGRATTCDQDVAGANTVGRWDHDRVAALWRGLTMTAIRQRHDALELGTFPVCVACSEYGRT